LKSLLFKIHEYLQGIAKGITEMLRRRSLMISFSALAPQLSLLISTVGEF